MQLAVTRPETDQAALLMRELDGWLSDNERIGRMADALAADLDAFAATPGSASVAEVAKLIERVFKLLDHLQKSAEAAAIRREMLAEVTGKFN